jgi:hypothetical protein
VSGVEDKLGIGGSGSRALLAGSMNMWQSSLDYGRCASGAYSMCGGLSICFANSANRGPCYALMGEWERGGVSERDGSV